MHQKKYLIIVEDCMEETFPVMGSPWRKTGEIELPANSPWHKIYTWEHPGNLVMEIKAGDKPVLVKVSSRGQEHSHQGFILIEINKLDSDQSRAVEEVDALYTRLMNLLARHKANIYTYWDQIKED